MRGRSKLKHRKTICHFCRKKGHIIADYYKLKNIKMAATKENEKRPENTGKVSVVEDDQSEGELY